MPVSPHFARNLVISACGGMAVFVIIARDEIPSLGYIYSYLYGLQPEAHGNLKEFGNSIRLPKPKKSIIEITDEVNAELQGMPEMRLRSISAAQRPCASGLIECQGMAEAWIVKAAQDERKDRAEKRIQKIAEEQAQAAKQSAEAAMKSAQAAKESAEAAWRSALANEMAAKSVHQSVMFAGYGGGITTFLALLAFLEFLTKLRERHAAAALTPPAPTAPATATAPPATPPTTNVAPTGTAANANPATGTGNQPVPPVP